MYKVLYMGPKYGHEAIVDLKDNIQVIHVEGNISDLEKKISQADAILDASMKVKISKELLCIANKMKIISCATTGSDHIDQQAAIDHGIEVRTLREDAELLQGLTPAAELSWALLMACARKLPEAIEHVKEGLWQRELFPGVMLKDKTFAVIGCGRIGKWMLRYAKAFDMKLMAYDPYTTEFPAGVRAATLEELARDADFISVHVHLSEETRNLVTQELIDVMKPGVILINTSRGGIIDESALIKGLQSGHIGAAGLDVIEGEPDIATHPLVEYARSHDNLIITPHCGGNSPDAVRVVCKRAFNKIIDVLDRS